MHCMTAAIVPLLTSAEVSEWLGVPRRTLDQWAYLGRGPAYVKAGQARRYDQRDVQAWIDSQRHGGPDAAA